MTALADAAAFLAGAWPCFPCGANKRPLTEHGFKDATRDPGEVRRMFQRPGTAMIGVPTGPASGLAVIDLDVKEGRFGLEWLAANQHRIPETRRHRTQSGGLHLLFRYPDGRRVRNSASKIAPGVDVRGEGGYVIVPPSPGYSLETDAMPAEMPGWLLDLIDPPAPPAQPVQARPLPATAHDGTRYGLAALDRECGAIMRAADGAKHDTLNRAAYSIGGLVTAGELAEGPAWAALCNAFDAIRHRCEDQRHGERTLRQAFDQGMAAPRSVPPPRTSTHTVRIEFAPPPGWDVPPPDTVPDYLQAEPDMAPDMPDTPARPAKPAQQRPAQSLPLIYFGDVTANLDAADFVEGLLTERALSVVYGDSNAGKTFWVTDLAIHVATGRKWRGREVEAGGVIYCALEGRDGISNRIAAFKAEHGLDGVDVPFAIIPVPINLLDPDADRERLALAVREAAEHMGVPVKMIVVDTLARALAGGNENSPEDMGALVNSADFIRQEVEAHVLFIHHSGKDQAKGARGHSSLRAATDTEIEVVRAEGAEIGTVRVTKQRDLPKGDTFAFKLRVVELGLNRRGKPVTSCVVDVPEGDEVPAATPARLPDSVQQAMTALSEAMAKASHPAPAGPDFPPNTRCVWMSEWRREFYGRSTAATQEAKQKAFVRASRDLIKRGLAACFNDHAWLVRDAE
jgi:hypothetical protein